jgi:glyoxylase-like metal-dependent hydrolase (beta-lactamase superfamily II)
MKIKSFAFNAFQENTFVVSDDSGEAIIIDAGCYDESEINTLVEYLETNNLTPVKLVNTHCHIDHVVGINPLKKKLNIPFAASIDDN